MELKWFISFTWNILDFWVNVTLTYFQEAFNLYAAHVFEQDTPILAETRPLP